MKHKFIVLYTKQKTKKQKSWTDGLAEYEATSGRLTLKDEKGSTLDSTFLKDVSVNDMVGERYETAGYLIDIDGFDGAAPPPSAQDAQTTAPVAKPLPQAPKKFKPPLANNRTFTPPLAQPKPPAQKVVSQPKQQFGRKHADIDDDDDNEEPIVEEPPRRVPPRATPQREPIANDFRTNKKPIQSHKHIEQTSDEEEEIVIPKKPMSVEKPKRRAIFDDDDEDGGVIQPEIQEEEDELDFDEVVQDTPSKPKVSSQVSSPPIERGETPTKPTPQHKVPKTTRVALPPQIPPKQMSAPSSTPSTPKSLVQTQLQKSSTNGVKITTPQKGTRHNQDSTPAVLTLVKQKCGTQMSLCFPDVAMYDILSGNPRFVRTVQVSDKFSTVHEYRTLFLNGVYEEMNLQMFRLGCTFRRVYAMITSSGSSNVNAPTCQHGKAKLLIVKKEGANQGRAFFCCPQPKEKGCNFFKWADELSKGAVAQRFRNGLSGGFSQNITNSAERLRNFRSNGIHYYYDVEIVGQSSPNFGRKRKGSEESEDSRFKGPLFIKLNEKEGGSPYAKDDVWIVSDTDEFKNVFIGRSVYHGPLSDGRLELKLEQGSIKGFPTNTPIFAIRGPNFSTEFEMIENLTNLNGVRLPLLYELLGNTEGKQKAMDDDKREFETQKSKRITLHKKPHQEEDGEMSEEEDTGPVSFEIGLEPEEISQMAQEFCSQFKLNEDQQTVLVDISKWFEPGNRPSAVKLVHGVFGAGKSYLLVVIIIFICHLLDECPNQDIAKHIRIMVSSVTNVAVDRILQGLLKEGFDSIIRVGSQKKIAKSILPYIVSSDKNQNEVIKDLKAMMKEELEEDELEGVKKALEEIKSGVADQRKDTIKDVRVVGVTCAATAFQVLQGNRFPILILDESSQCLEPLALLPLSRFSSQKLIAVGDPLQLPPTLVGASSNEDYPNTLEKTLFIRLSNVGFEPTMLRTQYRCHPRISALPNQMFYDKQLINGVSEEERAEMIPHLPPVTLIDVPKGKEMVGKDGSLYNEEEVHATTHIVQLLLASGVSLEHVGIIALYKSQAFKLRLALVTHGLKGVKVSTVDAFQGGEREIIVLTSCRTTTNLSFIENKKRLNVALTRARRHLIIVGCQRALNTSEVWRIVINQALIYTNGVMDIKNLEGRQTFDFLSEQDFDDVSETEAVAKRKVTYDDDEGLNDEDLDEMYKIQDELENQNAQPAKRVKDDDDETMVNDEEDLTELYKIQDEMEKTPPKPQPPAKAVTKSKKVIKDDDDEEALDKEDGEEEYNFDEPSLKRKAETEGETPPKKKQRVETPEVQVDVVLDKKEQEDDDLFDFLNDSTDDFGIAKMPTEDEF